MNRIMTAIAAGAVASSLAGCTVASERAVGGAVLSSLAGTSIADVAVGNTAPDQAERTDGTSSDSTASAPDYGAKKPHDHCGNGTMVHLGSVICSP